MWEKAQTYIFVTLITVLIWLYAESESLDTKPFYTQVEFGAGQKLLINPQRSGQIIVTVEGPRGRMTELYDQLSAKPLQIQVQSDPTGENLEQTIDLKQKLREHDIFKKLGFRLEKVDPPNLYVRVEPYITWTLPIAVRTNGDVQINANSTKIDPAEAQIEVPFSYAAAVYNRSARIDAVLQLDDVTLRQEQTKEVLLSFSDVVPAADVTITPNTATVTVTVESTERRSKELKLPVTIRYPIAEAPKYAFELMTPDETVVSVSFQGPLDVIKQIDEDIEARKKLVKLFVQLGAEDLAKAAGGEEISREVQFDLPPNVIPNEFPPPIRFKITRRQEQTIDSLEVPTVAE